MPARPIMIAVGGDSASGKTTLCRGLTQIFGAGRIATIDLDDYHALDREQRRAVGITAVDPRANNFAAMEEDLWQLREGNAIEKPVYDHRDGTFAPAVRVEPAEIVLVQGLFPLYTRALRSLFDIKVWHEPEAALQIAWKLQRDTLERGYTAAEVAAEAARRAPVVAEYLTPQAKFADFTVTFHRGGNDRLPADATTLSARIRKGGRFRPLDYDEFASASTSIRQVETTDPGGYPETIIDLDGAIVPASAEAVEQTIWTAMRLRSGTRPPRVGIFVDASGKERIGYALALLQLLIARRVVLVENELMASAL